MKIFVVLITLFFFQNASAHLEHVDGMGEKPTTVKLNFNRACFSEIRDIGCNHPRENVEIFRTCLEQKLHSLSPGCKKFFTKLYIRKKK